MGRLAWLCETDLEAQGVDVEAPATAKAPLWIKAKETWRAARPVSSFAIWSALLVYVVYSVVTKGQRVHALAYVVGLAWIVAAASGSLFWERRWWLVPGGLVCRESRAWRNKLGVRHYTTRESALFIDMRGGYGIVADGRRSLRFASPGWTSWAVLTAWLSRARTPTREEALAFVGSGCPVAPERDSRP
jgi:hypothetical protein